MKIFPIDHSVRLPSTAMSPPPPSPGKLKRTVDFLFGQAGLFGGLAAVSLGIIGVLVWLGYRPQAPEPDPPRLTFQKPATNDPTEVPGCIDIQFEAESPADGYAFLIGVYIPVRKQYVFEPDPERVGENVWARTVALGDEAFGKNEQFRVSVFMVRSEWVTFGKALGDDQDGGTWSSVEPPPGADELGGFDRTRTDVAAMNC